MRDTKRTRTILGLLLLTSLTLVVLSLRGGGGGARGTASGFFGPVENAASAVVRPVRDFLSSISSLGSKDQQIADLQAKVDALQQQLNTTEFDRNRAQELNDLLRLAGAGQYKTLPAQVIAIGPAQGFAWTVTIDVGTRDGVKIDQSVVNGKGLVGRIVATDLEHRHRRAHRRRHVDRRRPGRVLDGGRVPQRHRRPAVARAAARRPVRARGRGGPAGVLRREGRCLRRRRTPRDDHLGRGHPGAAHPHREGASRSSTPPRSTSSA